MITFGIDVGYHNCLTMRLDINTLVLTDYFILLTSFRLYVCILCWLPNRWSTHWFLLLERKMWLEKIKGTLKVHNRIHFVIFMFPSFFSGKPGCIILDLINLYKKTVQKLLHPGNLKMQPVIMYILIRFVIFKRIQTQRLLPVDLVPLCCWDLI